MKIGFISQFFDECSPSTPSGSIALLTWELARRLSRPCGVVVCAPRFARAIRRAFKIVPADCARFGLHSQEPKDHVLGFWRTPISIEELLISSVALVLLCATLVASFAHYPFYPCCFHQLSAAIRHWDFAGLNPSQPKEFWGYSYLTALVAAATGIRDDFAMVLVSSSMFVVANYLCCRLWGTTVAEWLMVVNYWWIDGATQGLTEPLFMALLLGSFIAVRRERWAIAAILASAATTVRPAGIFVLIAIGIILMVRREVRQLAIATAIGVATGIAYMIPMVLIFGDPLANLAGYRRSDWTSGLPLMLPVLPVIKSAMYGGAFVPSGRLHIVYSCVNLAWVLFALAAQSGFHILGIDRTAIRARSPVSPRKRPESTIRPD